MLSINLTIHRITRCTNAAHNACVLAKLIVHAVKVTGMKVWCRSANIAMKAVSNLLMFATKRCQIGIYEEVGVISVPEK